MAPLGWLARLRAPREAPAPAVVDLADPAFLADPYPVYAALRRDRPVAQVASGGWLLTRHADVAAALTHPDLGAAPSRFSTLHPRHRDRRLAAEVAAHILPFLDAPEHIAPRRILSRALRAAMRAAEADLPALAAAHAARARQQGAAELVGEVATPFALAATCRFMGLPESDGPALKRWSESFFHLFAPIRDAARLEAAEAGLAEFRAYFLDALRDGPAEGLMADLARPDAEGTALSDTQVADSLILIFADGVENVPYGAATVLMTLADHPQAAARAAADPAFARAATAEALRRDPPAQSIPRVARRDTEIAGQPIRADSPVFLSLGAANRDPEAFEAPEAFRPDRDAARALQFGAGRHSCLGAALATAQIAALCAALTGQGAATPTRPATAPYASRFGHRWPEAVALTFDAP